VIRRLSRSWRLGLAVVAIVAMITFPFMGFEAWIVNIAKFTLMYAALGTAWNFIGGMTGYISLGSVAFFGLGAYCLAITMEHVDVGSGWTPFLLVVPIGLAVALASIPLAFIAFRTRGLPFIIVTIALVIILQYLAFNLTSVTGGPPGLQVPLAPFDPGDYERNMYYGMLGVFLLSLGVSAYVMRSRLGLIMNAIREDEDKAEGLGVSVTAPKYIAFIVCAGLSAMVGAVWAYDLSTVYPQFAFDPEFLAMGIILVAYLGGIGTLWGPFIGALILTPAQQYLAYSLGASQYYLVAYALVFVLVMLFLPRGVVTTVLDRMRRREQRRRVERWSRADSVGEGVPDAHSPAAV
jgi:branched-chain amino acid transport system permease protein